MKVCKRIPLECVNKCGVKDIPREEVSGRKYRAFSYNVTAAISTLVFQNKEMAGILVYQSNPPGNELYFYANILFCFSEAIWPLVT